MGIKITSEEWIKEVGRQLNASESYHRSAKDWEGDITFVFEPDAGLTSTLTLFLGLYHGQCTDAALLAGEGDRRPEFVLRGLYSVWRLVIEAKLDPIQAMLTGKLKVRGNLMKIMRYPKAAKDIVTCCTLVPTEFV